MTRIIRLLAFIFATGAAWLVNAGVEPSPAAAAERNMLWQSREQFLALESQDKGETGPPAPNDHPAVITEEQLTTLLAQLTLRAADGSAPEPLFTRKSLETLAPKIVLGLRQAQPSEDLTFAVIGLHEALYGLAKVPRVTTGRLFVKNGRLNLIVGLAQRDVNEREDRRLAPFTPGSRKAAAAGDWLLQVPTKPTGYNMARRDWVTVATNWQPLPSTESPPTVPSNQAPKVLNQHEQSRSPAERLTTLQELKNKGLITDEEYRSKRLQILNEL
ncbi:MAG TPA: SHOCT domain-containing protein [Geobacteraceae bacterium]|nr:SHOCT domain-containing protein [Geobacteraceae bacterium]